MYPLVILGVVSLVLFILLQAINRNDMTNAGVSLLVGVIITYFIAFMRMSDKAKNNKNKDDEDNTKNKRNADYIFWFNPNY
jgi:arginine exporter protein ArgO